MSAFGEWSGRLPITLLVSLLLRVPPTLAHTENPNENAP
jgi:hypothetical protein